MTKSNTIAIRGAELAFTESGPEGGRLAISAHGLSSSRASTLTDGIGDFSAVANSGARRLVSYDARGHGESTGTLDPADYEWSRLALDLLAIADRFSPGIPVAGIGLSMGTGTLLHAVAHLPGRFDRLVLSAPPTAWETRGAQAVGYEALADSVERFLRAGAPEQATALLESAPMPPIFRELDDSTMKPSIDLALLPTVFRGAGRSNLPSFEAIAAIQQPTLILAWSGDPGHPVSTAEKLAELIPDARLEVADTLSAVRGWGERAAEFLREPS